MKNQTVIVTGASTGIGKGIAQYFLDKGDNVVINSANKSRLKETFAEFNNTDRLVMVPGDISDKKVGQQLVSAAMEKFGRVDILVNNAGIFKPKPFLEVDEQELDEVIRINLKGTYLTTQAVIRQMLLQGEGAVVNIGAAWIDHPIGEFGATASLITKGGIHTLTRLLAAEFGRNNIRVNTVAPGVIRTPLQAKTGVDDADSLAPLHLLDRIGEVEDVAEMVYLVAKSNFITGATINVDGGHAAGHHLKPINMSQS